MNFSQRSTTDGTSFKLRACFENRSGKGLRARRGGWRGATRAHIREKSATEEQRSQPPRPAQDRPRYFQTRSQRQFHSKPEFLPIRSRPQQKLVEEPWMKLVFAMRRRHFCRRASNMSKRIIFCADGTWDSAQDDTNVYKLFKAVPITSDQVAFYDDGVARTALSSKSCLAARSATGCFKK